MLVHADEMRESQNNPHAHEIDRVALYSALDQPDVQEWVEAMTKMAMAPLKRSRPAVADTRPIQAGGQPKEIGGRKVPKPLKTK